MPRARTDSTTSHTEQDYIIAQRTRSKISLAETPIEAIESTFKAPDAPLDMYQVDWDDPHWTNFLTGLSMPMSKIGKAATAALNIAMNHLVLIVYFFFFFAASEIEKDEDTDPDYCPAMVDIRDGSS